MTRRNPDMHEQTSDRLLELLSARTRPSSSSADNAHADELPLPSEQTVKKLNERATSRLAQMARLSNSRQFDQVETSAVKELLDRSTEAVTR